MLSSFLTIFVWALKIYLSGREIEFHVLGKHCFSPWNLKNYYVVKYLMEKNQDYIH